MTCGYCGARISEEGRCLRCRRKPEDTLTGEVALNRTEGALAAQMQPSLLKHAGLVGIPGAARPGSKLARPVQGSLFWERPAGKVVALESFQTPPTSTVARPRATGAMPSPGTLVRRPSRVAEEQGTLDFLPSAQAKPRTLGTKVDAVIYCEEPVASRMHRAVAAGFDWSMVLLAYGLFLLVFRLGGGQFILSQTNLLILGGVLPLLGCLYGLTWAVAGNETAGMRWANLRLTTFDGFRPERGQRLMRFAGSCLSLCTVVGLLWSFADEESLSWSDHISRTFPTPRRLESQVFHRR